ncbi:hypothetical protein [Streptomyces sp. NPDC006285]|uniref:hypothetical protein n=1 Tax=Streptomyces sp. NPDC006285 TaxID=3364742 RepID=UPI0036B4E21C
MAITMVATSNRSIVDFERGPILFRAFPGGYDSARALTSAQHALLQAFVDTDEATGNIRGNWLWFRAAGLPENREGIAALL